MKTLTALTLALATGFSLMADFSPLPLPMPCGQIVHFEKTDQPQSFVDFDKAAESQEAEPSDELPAELAQEKTPDPGMVFAIFTVNVLPDRSLSKYDFILENDRGQRMPCLDMGLGAAGFFDFRLKVQTGPKNLKLIFQCPANSYEIRLKPAFTNITLPPIGDFKINDRPKPKPAPKPAAKDAAKPAAKDAKPAAKDAKPVAKAPKAPAPKPAPAKK